MIEPHTPGEWKAFISKGKRSYVCASSDDNRFWPVAVIKNGKPGDTLDTETANANLISAAPNLLAALKGMMQWQRSVREFVPDELCDQALAAIAKAEGGAA